jgi:hypothetical protein
MTSIWSKKSARGRIPLSGKPSESKFNAISTPDSFLRVDGKVYALKKIKLGGLKPKEFDNSINEIRILASIENPYIICKLPTDRILSNFLSL